MIFEYVVVVRCGIREDCEEILRFSSKTVAGLVPPPSLDKGDF
jgi:hypothetical protein